MIESFNFEEFINYLQTVRPVIIKTNIANGQTYTLNGTSWYWVVIGEDIISNIPAIVGSNTEKIKSLYTAISDCVQQ